MNTKRLILGLVGVIFCLSINPVAAQNPSEIKVLSSNLAQSAISEVIPMFEKAHKIKVWVEYANNPIIKQRIEAGAKFDVVIIAPQMLTDLSKAGLIDKNSLVDLAKVGMALISKEGSPGLDIGSVESFKKVLLSAKSIAYTADGHSGSVFLGTLEKMGLADQMKPKLVPVVGRFSTLAVAEGTAQYTAFPAVGFGPGVQVAGMFPEEVQTYIGVSAGVSPKALEAVSARKFLEYLQSKSANAVFKSQGYMPVAIAQVGVPIEKEPMHRLKFENEFVRVFDVLIPAGRTSLFHTHIYNGLSVFLSNTLVEDEALDGLKAPIAIKYAEAAFGARPTARTHRVVNSGKSDFRNIFIEILASKHAVTAGSFPILSDGHVILIDNDRVRVNRLILKPGESSKLHTHQMRGLGVILYDSKIEMISAEGTRRILEPKAGDFVWQEVGTTHIIKNIGSTVFSAIDVEIK